MRATGIGEEEPAFQDSLLLLEDDAEMLTTVDNFTDTDAVVSLILVLHKIVLVTQKVLKIKTGGGAGVEAEAEEGVEEGQGEQDWSWQRYRYRTKWAE